MVFVLGYEKGYDAAWKRAKGLFDVDDPWSFKMGTRREFFLDELGLLEDCAGVYKKKEGVFELSEREEVFWGARTVVVDDRADFLFDDVLGVVKRVGKSLATVVEGLELRSVQGECVGVREFSDAVYGLVGHHPVQLCADVCSVDGVFEKELWEKLCGIDMFEYLFLVPEKQSRNLEREGFFVVRYGVKGDGSSCVRFKLKYANPVESGARAALSRSLEVVERLNSSGNPSYVFSNVRIRYHV